MQTSAAYIYRQLKLCSVLVVIKIPDFDKLLDEVNGCPFNVMRKNVLGTRLA